MRRNHVQPTGFLGSQFLLFVTNPWNHLCSCDRWPYISAAAILFTQFPSNLAKNVVCFKFETWLESFAKLTCSSNYFHLYQLNFKEFAFFWNFKPCFHLQRRSVFLLVQDARSICIFYQCQRPQAFIADCRIVPAHHQAVCPRAKFSVTIAPFLLDTVPVRSNYPVSFPLPTQEGKNI